jgi:ribosomal protein S27AE
MSIAQGSCPQCGAPMSFGIGASISQVCKYCRHVVVRTDRDFRNMGRAADLALTPSPVAVGDLGSVEGSSMSVLGRVQLDHGEGPWDEWYIAFNNGQWGWLASAQGNWYLTAEVPNPGPLPFFDQLSVEQDVPLAPGMNFRVVELKRGTITSGEGELPFAVAQGQERYYADLVGPNGGFATIDYGDRSAPPQLFIGKQLPEAAIQIKPMGERPVTEINTDALTCPNCGGRVPAMAPKKSERLACPYCGAVSEIAAQRVIEMQEAARMRPDIPLGTRGSIQGQEYVVCGYVERSAEIEGESFTWQEYLLYGPGLGFRWLVKDESTWMWITPLNLTEIDISRLPHQVAWQGQTYSLRNRNQATVSYVLGEFYWKVRKGETVDAMDFLGPGGNVVSRERAGDEVAWSLGSPVPWPQIAQAFNLPLDGGGGQFTAPGGASDGEGDTSTAVVIIVIIVIIIVLLVLCGSCDGSGGGGGGGVWISGGGSRGGK